jgi:hypothetical protein
MAFKESIKRLITVSPYRIELKCLKEGGTLPIIQFSTIKPKTSKVKEIPLEKTIADVKVI